MGWGDVVTLLRGMPGICLDYICKGEWPLVDVLPQGGKKNMSYTLGTHREHDT